MATTTRTTKTNRLNNNNMTREEAFKESKKTPDKISRGGITYKRLNLGESIVSYGVSFLFDRIAYYDPKKTSLINKE